MSKIDQFFEAKNVKVFTEGLDSGYRVCFCSPQTSLKIVILSKSRGLSDRSIPHGIIEAASRVVSSFNLNPSQVVWVEHLPSSPSLDSCESFQLIQFDWQAGQAVNLRRSPIGEAWYLAWLQGELYPSQLRQALEPVLST
ncbi:MAG: hypothetical protein DCF32_22645 [Leptolyngbya sp.]|nr:MAG: hypothetical protein DCF32_22645 [Leptolyngbya sp.]